MFPAYAKAVIIIVIQGSQIYKFQGKFISYAAVNWERKERPKHKSGRVLALEAAIMEMDTATNSDSCRSLSDMTNTTKIRVSTLLLPPSASAIVESEI